MSFSFKRTDTFCCQSSWATLRIHKIQSVINTVNSIERLIYLGNKSKENFTAAYLWVNM